VRRRFTAFGEPLPIVSGNGPTTPAGLSLALKEKLDDAFDNGDAVAAL
jgi:hypothetical protein